MSLVGRGQINTNQVMRVGQNSLYLEDYMLAIQYFNQVIAAKPYLAQPYFYRAIAKISLEDYRGAEADASAAIKRNPYIAGAYEVRGAARQNLDRPSEAIDDYNKAIEQLPHSKEILFKKALAQQDVKDYDGAKDTYATLLKYHPRYDNAYVGRARLHLVSGDTVSALVDADRAIEINRNNVNAYLIRADVAISSEKDYAKALADMDEAIKLQPRYAGFFVNRAFLRYNLDDYFGAMADFDYAIQLDPLNVAALYNRGLLRAEVHDNNKAIDDFSRVLGLDPDNYKALFNRALLLNEIARFDDADADLTRVIAAYPSFAGAYYARFESRRARGDNKRAKSDYDIADRLSRQLPADADCTDEDTDAGKTPEETQRSVSARFTTLLTVDDNAQIKEEYHTRGVKGRVQDRNLSIEIEPMFALSYYVTTSELRETPYYVKEVDDLNATRLLRFGLMITNREPKLDDEDNIQRHFKSVAYYDSYLATHTPRAVDYFARAMDHYTLRNFEQAISDLDEAIRLTPDFTLAYMARAAARHRQASSTPIDAVTNVTADQRRIVARAVRDDLERVIELSPRMALAHYNLGNLLVENGDLTSALTAYSRAIEFKPDLGEAYYNRGYVYFKLGNKESGIADLSKAGELGIMPSYNLLKRMNQ